LKAGLVFLFLLISCQNPTKVIRRDIERFEREYPDHFATYKTVHRQMGFAWSGNPAKPPLLLIHGSPGSWKGWAQFLLDKNLQKKFHLIAIDRPGFGVSGEGKAETSLEKQAALIFESLLFNSSKKRAIVIGHSLGGPVAARLAMDYPEKFSGLIFVAASVDPNLEKIKWFQYPGRWFGFLLPKDLRVCNEEIFPLKDELEKMLPYWKKIQAKVVIIQGEEDNLVPAANVDFLLEHLPKENIVDVVKVPNLNHFVPWKRPELILQAIEKLSNP
jgi:pimeloyl-ACP methyl ester carboxylesterase